MTRKHFKAMAALAGLVWLLTGCREDPGRVDYSALGPTFDRLNPDGGLDPDGAVLFQGPKPYKKGDKRLSVGMFYEGEHSDVVPVDRATSNYFIWDVSGTLGFEQTDETLDRVEGEKSDRITLNGTSYWGCSIVWDPARTLSKWTTLALSLKSSTMGAIKITMGSASKEVAVQASDYGYAADGQWHHLRIPLADFADGGVDLSKVDFAFGMSDSGGKAGEQFLVDDLYIDR